MRPSQISSSSPGNPVQASQLLLIGLWSGILAGLMQVLFLGLEKFLLHHSIGFGLDVVWMAPLATALLFLIPAILLSLLAQRTKQITLFVVVFVFALLAFLSVLLDLAWLHPLAALLLSAGLGIQTARFVTLPPKRLTLLLEHARIQKWLPARLGRKKEATVPLAPTSKELITRREFLIMAGATVTGLTIGAQGWKGFVEDQKLASLPTTVSGLPNVLLVVLDTVRAQSLSLYGYGRPTTPMLKQWANQGVVFNRALATAPWTLPSHASMFTGKYPHELSANWTTPLDDAQTTLAEVLSGHGYETAGFVANLVYASAEHGLARGFSHYEDYPVSFGELALSSSLGRFISNQPSFRRLIGNHDILDRKSAADINRAFLAWLTGRDVQRPFFAFLNYYDAHEPYLPPPPYNDQFGASPQDRGFDYMTDEVERPLKWTLSPAEIQTERNAYDGTIAYTDQQLGLLLDELKKRSLLNNTLVIITADHGEQLGEHGLFSHGNSLYLQTLHVPLVILFPGKVPQQTVIQQPVSLRNVPSTILDLLDLHEPHPFGPSLTRFWRTNTGKGNSDDLLLSDLSQGVGVQPWYRNASGEMHSLVIGTQHYIKNGNGSEELYDLVNDPFETHDLMSTNQSDPLTEQFRITLQKTLAQLKVSSTK